MDIQLVSWNVNGLRAVANKEDWQWFHTSKADIIALQETKANPSQLAPELSAPKDWHSFFASSIKKKGYSGVAVYSRMKPLAVQVELPEEAWQGEGRILHLEYEHFHFINGYFPNGGEEILSETGKHQGLFKRLEYKMGFFDAFLRYATFLRQTKPVVVCGDFNIAHQPIDLARPQQNTLNTGFLAVERAFLDTFTQAGWIDTFRFLHQEESGAYSWWSYKTKARERNIGWRIDYFFVSQELKDNIVASWIEREQYGSDHCPVGLQLRF